MTVAAQAVSEAGASARAWPANTCCSDAAALAAPAVEDTSEYALYDHVAQAPVGARKATAPHSDTWPHGLSTANDLASASFALARSTAC